MIRLLMVMATVGWSSASFGLLNTERFRPGKFVEGFSGNMDGTLSLTKGNVDVLDVGATGRIQYQTRNAGTALDQLADELSKPEIFGDRWLLLADVRFARNAGNTFVNRFMTHLRWTHMYRDWIGSELYGQYQSDQFTLSLDRTLAGAGVRLELIRRDWGHIWFGTGYMAEFEHLDLQPGDTTHQRYMLNHRSSSYLTAKFPIGGTNLTISNTLYFQPLWTDPADFRALDVFEVEVDLTTNLALLVTAEVAHDNRPPMGVRKTDTRIKNSLRLNF